MWDLFGELRSALAAHDWQGVAVLMDERGGCDDERARRYAYNALMGLDVDARPFRIAVGSGKVGRASLTSARLAGDIVGAMKRTDVYGANFLIAPIYGFTPKAFRAARGESWNTQPVAIRAALAAARLDVVLDARASAARTNTAAMQNAALSSIILSLQTSGISDNHIAAFKACEQLFDLGHPRLAWPATNATGFPHNDAQRKILDKVLREVVGDDVVSAINFRTSGGWKGFDGAQAGIGALTRCGNLRTHLLRAAGSWPVPSPLVDGQPGRVQCEGSQIDLLGGVA